MDNFWLLFNKLSTLQWDISSSYSCNFDRWILNCQCACSVFPLFRIVIKGAHVVYAAAVKTLECDQCMGYFLLKKLMWKKIMDFYLNSKSDGGTILSGGVHPEALSYGLGTARIQKKFWKGPSLWPS